MILWLWDFSFFLSSTFVYEPILLKISMNANIVKTEIFHRIKYDLKGHSRSQTMTFLFKNNFIFSLFYSLIKETNAAEHYERTKFDLYKDDLCLILTLTYVLMDNFLSLFFPWIAIIRIKLSGQYALCMDNFFPCSFNWLEFCEYNNDIFVWKVKDKNMKCTLLSNLVR
jgi:hypothetical protein